MSRELKEGEFVYVKMKVGPIGVQGHRMLYYDYKGHEWIWGDHLKDNIAQLPRLATDLQIEGIIRSVDSRLPKPLVEKLAQALLGKVKAPDIDKCPACNGCGHYRDLRCFTCGGTGLAKPAPKMSRERLIEILKKSAYNHASNTYLFTSENIIKAADAILNEGKTEGGEE